MQQFFKKMMGEMPIGIDMVAYVYNRLVDGAFFKSISNALQINDTRQLQRLILGPWVIIFKCSITRVLMKFVENLKGYYASMNMVQIGAFAK